MRGNEIHGNESLYKRQVAVLKDCANPAREITLAFVATESAVLACGTMVFTTIRTNNVLLVTNTPTCFDDCLSACGFVIEVHCHCDKAVELCEIYHDYSRFTVCYNCNAKVRNYPVKRELF